jgi:prephenate dehydrogenase
VFSTITIVGVGLIGGSMGLAARRTGIAQRVIGVGRDQAKLQQAIKLGAINEASTDLAVAVRDADLMVVCTPVNSIAQFVLAAATHAKPQALITDAGSTKATIVKEVEAGLQKLDCQAQFVGSHPMAGSEKNGAEHARADLFEGRAVIVTPGEHSSHESVDSIEGFWQALGANVFRLSPSEHDRAVAAISHVPHVVASALAAGTPPEYFPLVAGGWLDATRIAAGDPELWRQILSQNRSHVLNGIAAFEKVLAALRDALESENDTQLRNLLQAGKNARDVVGSRHSPARNPG